MPVMNKLSVLKARSFKDQGRYSDGAGLYLQVGPTGTKSWLFQFKSPSVGKERQLGLGSADIVSLEQARQRAQAARDLLQNCIDPIDHKREQRQAAVELAKAAAIEVITFEKVASAFFWMTSRIRGKMRSIASKG